MDFWSIAFGLVLGVALMVGLFFGFRRLVKHLADEIGEDPTA